ncbi:MAG: 30S ribosomal protein S18 [Leptospiraceae bacterium]|nr:MAG: 30S ribosomal protein S18 [Leptospiraceae bacterium]
MSEELQNTENQNNQKEQDNKNPIKFRYKKRVLDTRGLEIDYRKPEVLQRFISKTGKILPRRMTGATAKVQRKIAKEIKRARMANLLPFTKR